MLVQVCYPAFDTRFYRDADGAGNFLPRWLFSDPPRFPAMKHAGGLGPVVDTIPPQRYARCFADRLIDVSATDAAVSAWADRSGHIRIAVGLRITYAYSPIDLDETIDEILSAPIMVRHPQRRGEYASLGEVADDLADCYGRETGRTAERPHAPYKLDWVQAGRPYLLVVKREERSFVSQGWLSMDQ